MAEDWKCSAQPRAAVPTDCNWPNCVCDPHAERVMEGLREAGWMDPDDIRELKNEIIEGCARAAEAQDRVGREWVADSLWDKVCKRAGENVRALLR